MDCSGACFDFSDPQMTWNKFLPEFVKVLDYLNQIEVKVNLLQARNKDLESQLNCVRSTLASEATVTPPSHNVVGITQESIDKSNSAMEQICERLYLLECAQESDQGHETYHMGNLEPAAERRWKAHKIEAPQLTTAVMREPPIEEIPPSKSCQFTSQPERRTIVLHRGQRGLGFSIVGGCGFPQGDFPIIVKETSANGAADGRLKPGDQIISVNGKSLGTATPDCIVSIFKNAEDPITLVVIRPYATPTHSTPTDENPVLDEKIRNLIHKWRRNI